METNFIERHRKWTYPKNPYHQETAKQNIPTPFRPLPEVADYEPHFFDPQYQR